MPDLRAVPDENHRLERALKWGFAIVVALLVLAAVIQILYVRLGNERTSEVAQAQEDILVSQDQADRNLAVQACQSAYAATSSAWDSEASKADQEADAIFARLISISRANDDDPRLDALLVDYRAATDRAEMSAANYEEMSLRRLGLAELAADEAESRSNDFACPGIPARLQVEPLDPTNPDPP